MNTHEIVKLNTVEGLSHLKDYYHISNTGKIYSTYRQDEGELKEIVPYLVGIGYHQVQLSMKQGGYKNLYVHRLVGMVFVEGYAEWLVINHKDENKLNNHYMNLEWVTQKENINYGSARERAVKTQMLNRCAKKFLSDPVKRREYVRLQARLDIMGERAIRNLATNVFFSKRFFLNYVKLRLVLVLTIKEEMLSMQDS